MSEDLPVGKEVDERGAGVHSGSPGLWIVWRQDDNGNRFEVARFVEQADADALATASRRLTGPAVGGLCVGDPMPYCPGA